MDVGVGVGVAFHTSCVVGTCSCLLAVVAVVVGSSSWPLVAVNLLILLVLLGS